MKRLRWVAAALIVPATATAAWAMWTAEVSPGGHGSAAATEVEAGRQPTASADGATVTVAWEPSTLGDGSPVTAYVVTRTSLAGEAATTGATCSGRVAATSCTETVPDGVWRYTVTPTVGAHWRGPTSPKSEPVVVDTTGPTGGSVTVVGLTGPFSTSTSLSLRLDPGTDPQGIAAGATLLRAEAPLTAGTCQPFGAAVAIRTDPPTELTDTVPAGERCFRYEYVVRDSFGNATTLTSNVAAVDTTAPTTPSLTLTGGTNAFVKSPTTVYYRPGVAGSIRVKAASTDQGSGIGSFSLPALGAGWSLASNSGEATYTWNGTPAAPTAARVTAQDKAGNTSVSGAFSVLADATAPTGATVSYAQQVTSPEGFTTASRLPMAFQAGTDAQSGVAGSVLQRARAVLGSDSTCGPFGAFEAVVNGELPVSPRLDPVDPGFCYQYRYATRDQVGNVGYSAVSAVAKVLYSGYATNVRSTEALSSYWRLGEPTMVSDSFTAPAGTEVLNRKPDEGNSVWLNHSMTAKSATVTAGGRVRRTTPATATAGSVFFSATPQDQTDYTVEADLFQASPLTNDAVALVARLNTSNATGYAAGYDQATNTWQLLRVTQSTTGIVKTELARTAPEPLTTGRTYHVALDMHGDRMILLVDGVERLRAIDNDISIGTGGFLLGFGGGTSPAPTDTTGLHLDNVRITPSARNSAGGPAGFYLGAPALGQAGIVPGDLNTAGRFDGVNDEVRVTARLEQSTSVELWLKSAPGSGTGTGLTWRDAAGLFSSDQLGLGLAADGSVVAGSGDITLRSGAGLADGSWHHVVLTRSADRLRLYVDAVEVASAATPAAVPDSAAAVRLGRGPGGAYAGLLDEVAAYTSELSPQTVAAHHAVALSGS